MRGSPSDTGCSQEDLTRQLELSFRGRTLAVNVALNAPVADVLRNVIASCEAILRAEQWNAGKEDTNVRLDPATCKMVVPGRGILDLQKISKNPTQPISTFYPLGKSKNSMKAIVIGTEMEVVKHMREMKEDTRSVGFDEELERYARRLRASVDARAKRPGPGEHGFLQCRAWDRRGLNPPVSRATMLLERLASDPGILHLMGTYSWRVPVLSEMPPEGLVGVSPVCVLGVNINKGQEISLRIRTDDLRGVRKYETIRTVLVHELAHMRHDGHGDDFKQFNAELLRAASPFWTPSGTTGQTLSSEAALSQVESLLREIKKRWEGPLVVSPETLPTTGEASEPHATDTPFTDTQSESPRASRGLVSPPLRQIRVAETPAFSAGSLLLGGGPSVMERQGKGGESAGGDPVSPRGHGGFAQWDFEQAGSHEGQGGEEGGRERRGLATSVRWKEMCMLGVGAWGGVDEELAKGNGVADASLKRAVKAKHASERVLDACQSPGEAVQVFTTLRTVIHNASRPFASLQRRQVRLGNPAFHSRVGRFPGALDVLLSAGFHRAEEPLVPRGWETMPENEEQRRTDEDEEETGDDDWMVMAHVDSAAVWIVDCVLSAVLERLVAARGMGLPTRA